jgi:hypothetical protein
MSWTEPVKYRQLITSVGDVFDVPEYIVRVDGVCPGHWQLRYGEWTDYADASADQAGSEASLRLAIVEMLSRIEYRGK